MNPAQLLNPKAFAKEQAKTKKRPKNLDMDQSGFYPAHEDGQEIEFFDLQFATNQNFDYMLDNPIYGSNYEFDAGPQQTRKTTLGQAPKPAFDPSSLLNPKAASGSRPDLKKDDSVEEAEGSARQLIEKHYHLQNREDAPVRKRKVQVVDDDSDSDRKKQKAAGTQIGGGGLLAAHVNDEQKRLQSAAKNNTIDLTNDDDVVVLHDGEVQIAMENGNPEVSLGLFQGSANMFRIPSASEASMRAVGKEHWPKMKVGYRRELSNNTVVDLVDREGSKFATLDAKSASGLCPLMAGISVNRMRVKMYLSSRSRKHADYVGKRVSENAKLDIYLWAPLDKSVQIGKFLSQKQIFLRKPQVEMGAAFHDTQVPHNYKPALVKSQGHFASVQRTVEEMKRETSNMFDRLAKEEDLPKIEADASVIASPLLTHQQQALHFLTEHERDDFEPEGPQHSLWTYKILNNGKPAWHHVITGQEVYHRPEIIRGGILADVMGLGKTLSILALIAETREASKRFRGQEPPESDTIERNARGTLIVCPKSVLSNWQQQIGEHTIPGTMKVCMYHGTNRSQDLRELSRHDIVLTTYNTVAAELGRRQKMSALVSLNWFRIVLDEAHSIRTHSTQVSKACCSLDAQRRWAVTGTPVQNNLNDLGALLKFLHLNPFDDPATWARYIMSPFKQGQVDVIDHLQLLVGSITLRRAKAALEVALPIREEHRERLTFSQSEAILYKQFATKTRTQFHRISQNGNALKGKAYAHILKSISRLRMICAHGPEMLTDEDMKDIEGDDPSNAIVLDIGDEPGVGDGEELISEKLAYETLAMMVDSDAAVCTGCGEKLPKLDDESEGYDASAPTASSSSDSDDSEHDDHSDEEDNDNHTIATRVEDDIMGYLTPCYHLICCKCIGQHEQEVSAVLTPDHHYSCQYCEQYVRYWLFALQRRGYKRYKYMRAEDAKKPKTARWDENTYKGPHTKVKALLEDLRRSAEESEALPPGEPPIRSVVFSGWTSYLDLIEYALTNHNIGFTRIDGAMSVKQRSQALNLFNTDDNVTVLLVSIKAGGQGLNFTAASKAYVMEPQFNPGVEQQAVDRIHRIGQTRPVTIKHFIMQGSIEEGILNLQKKKEDLAKLSMERKRSRAEESKQRMVELKALFK